MPLQKIQESHTDSSATKTIASRMWNAPNTAVEFLVESKVLARSRRTRSSAPSRSFFCTKRRFWPETFAKHVAEDIFFGILVDALECFAAH